METVVGRANGSTAVTARSITAIAFSGGLGGGEFVRRANEHCQNDCPDSVRILKPALMLSALLPCSSEGLFCEEAGQKLQTGQDTRATTDCR